MDDQQFRQLLIHFQYSWSGYRKVRKGVKKRINRHMHQLGCRNMDAYLATLDQSHKTRKECELLLTVSISRFFRDRKFWHTLEKKLLPELLELQQRAYSPQLTQRSEDPASGTAGLASESKISRIPYSRCEALPHGRTFPDACGRILPSRAGKVKVWSAGCACGDEVYSFKIVWQGLKESYDNIPKLEVLATDINPVYLERARAGVYSTGSLKEVKKELISKYFLQQRSKNQYAIKTALAKDVAFKVHYLLLDPPGSNFDIIFLRNNILTYYQDRLKKKALNNVLKSLAPSGLLVIGSHETLPYARHDLVRVAPHPFVFRKRAENAEQGKKGHL